MTLINRRLGLVVTTEKWPHWPAPTSGEEIISAGIAERAVEHSGDDFAAEVGRLLAQQQGRIWLT